MQARSLHMVAVKGADLPKLFGHNIGLDQLPYLSITSHPTPDNQIVWQCGGKIAEDGVNKSKAQQIATFKAQLAAAFPWLDFTKPEYSWDSFMINRAENLRDDGKKPTHATWFTRSNTLFAWPTQLVLAPMMAEAITEHIQDKLAVSQSSQSYNSRSNSTLAMLSNLPKPQIATPWWNNL